MDLKISGEFIKEQRKLKGLTQAELAEKLNISEKAVSKWECGKGFPDTSLILPLCEELNISANELLSAKKINDEQEYKISAENNLIKMQSHEEMVIKLALKIEWVLGTLSVLVLLGLIVIAAYWDTYTWLRVLLCIGGAVFALVGLFFCIIIEKDAGFYQCRHCEHKFIPTLKQAIFSPHMGRTKYIRCPKCGKKGWNKKVIK